MPSWHAYTEQPTLAPNTEVLITGGHLPVRVMTADQLTIEMPGDRRLMAVVVDRTGERLTLALGDGTLLSLHMAPDSGFAHFQLSEGFSRQSWMVE